MDQQGIATVNRSRKHLLEGGGEARFLQASTASSPSWSTGAIADSGHQPACDCDGVSDEDPGGRSSLRKLASLALTASSLQPVGSSAYTDASGGEAL